MKSPAPTALLRSAPHTAARMATSQRGCQRQPQAATPTTPACSLTPISQPFDSKPIGAAYDPELPIKTAQSPTTRETCRISSPNALPAPHPASPASDAAPDGAAQPYPTSRNAKAPAPAAPGRSSPQPPARHQPSRRDLRRSMARRRRGWPTDVRTSIVSFPSGRRERSGNRSRCMQCAIEDVIKTASGTGRRATARAPGTAL